MYKNWFNPCSEVNTIIIPLFTHEDAKNIEGLDYLSKITQCANNPIICSCRFMNSGKNNLYMKSHEKLGINKGGIKQDGLGFLSELYLKSSLKKKKPRDLCGHFKMASVPLVFLLNVKLQVVKFTV